MRHLNKFNHRLLPMLMMMLLMQNDKYSVITFASFYH